MSDIFICYSRTDGAFAAKLVQHLRAEGWSVFLDVDTRVGQPYNVVIEEELDAARAAIVLWSAASRKSHDVLDEAKRARDRKILFPALIESVKPPLGFGHIQTANLVGSKDEAKHSGLEQLLESLRLHLNTAQRNPPEATSKPVEPIAATLLDAAGTTASVPRQRVEPIAAAALEAAQAGASKTRPPAPGHKTFRDTLKAGGEGPLMVVIPAGRFVMGSPPDEPERSDSEGPQHEVRIAEPFAMGVYALTFEEYDRYCQSTKGEKPKDAGWGRAQRPVINVSWEEAQAYCAWLSEQTGRTYRLPSEAEWEYACRAGTTTPFHFGERLSTDQANFDGNYTYNGSAKGEYREKTVPVGSFAATAFGLHDMHGNVEEWCQDTWNDNYQGAPADGSARESERRLTRVIRGGAYSSDPRLCRAAARYYRHPGDQYGLVGFRVCRGAPIETLTTAPLTTGLRKP